MFTNSSVNDGSTGRRADGGESESSTDSARPPDPSIGPSYPLSSAPCTDRRVYNTRTGAEKRYKEREVACVGLSHELRSYLVYEMN